MKSQPQIIKLSDYLPYAYSVSQVSLDIELEANLTQVTSCISLTPNQEFTQDNYNIMLNGEDLILISVHLNDIELTEDSYQCEDNLLNIKVDKWRAYTLKIVTQCEPRKNLQLSGLYESSNCLVTQCEAQGFRRITYYPDRPDVLSRFKVTLRANKEKYPVLLANGNLMSAGDSDNGTHWATWDDPFFKPSYLFALVAGNLSVINDSYTTLSGKKIQLAIYANEQQINQCHYAMHALKAAMDWDEVTYGCECDLDQYMLVAVNDFNSGAMENKGLNIFNSKYILADPKTATDLDYQNVLAVIGHEYFHNWSGNRVTCRDWFQLSLKEGFTIFREQQFMASQLNADICRINEVKRIRTEQFAQDASSMAHPVQPDEFIEIRNFYTVTIYEKGAELIRMLYRIVSAKGFIAGAKRYFETYDGKAVTINDFVEIIAATNKFDATQFFKWYKQAGTPTVIVSCDFNSDTKVLTMRVSQSCDATPNQPDKPNFYIPMAVSLLDQKGDLIELSCGHELASSLATEAILPITEREQSFTFNNVPEGTVPSLFRNFSAPVKCIYDYSTNELIHLATFDSDPVSRWDAVQNLILNCFNGTTDLKIITGLFSNLLTFAVTQPGLIAEMVTLPDERYVFEMCSKLSLDEMIERYDELQNMMANQLKSRWQQIYTELSTENEYQFDEISMATRSMKNVCGFYLGLLNDDRETVYQQFCQATNMTDRFAALKNLNNQQDDYRESALTEFWQRFSDNPLVLDMWYALQAKATFPEALTRLEELMTDERFNWKNPNRLYATVAAFSRQNLRGFHAIDGSGYHFLAKALAKVDSYNSEVAARLAEPFTRWPRLDSTRQQSLKSVVAELITQNNLSSDILEILQRI